MAKRGRPPKSDAERQADAERILPLAADCFCRRGYDRTTTRDLAVACDVSEPTLYRAYGSKEGVYVAVLGWICARRLARLRAVLSAAGPSDRAARLERAEEEMSRERPDDARLLAHALGCLASRRIRDVAGEHYRQVLDLLADGIGAAAKGKGPGRRELRWLAWMELSAMLIGPLAELMRSDALKDPAHRRWLLEQAGAAAKGDL